MRYLSFVLLVPVLSAVVGDPPLSGGDVSYIQSRKVSEAFAKGAPLLEVSDYKVHASRREAPGQAEVHERDTDIIYVLEGRAKLVTGGAVVEGQPTGPYEIRGKEIRGGETYDLVKGDVLVVPNGTPHWFKEVSQAPFLYYVVKVTDHKSAKQEAMR